MKSLFFPIFILMIFFHIQLWSATATIGSQLSRSARQTTLGLDSGQFNLFSKFSTGVYVDGYRSIVVAEYNSELSDFENIKQGVNLGFDFSWDELLQLSIEGFSENLDNKTANGFGTNTKIAAYLPNFSLTLSLNDLYTRQQNEFIVLNRDIKNNLTLRTQKQSVYFKYYGFEDFSINLRYDKYNYDRDLQAFNSVLNLKNVLNQNGSSFLSQVSSPIDEEYAIGGTYMINDSFDLDASFSELKDYLSPYEKTNSFRTGLVYYVDRWILASGVTAIKAQDVSESSYSIDLTGTVRF